MTVDACPREEPEPLGGVQIPRYHLSLTPKRANEDSDSKAAVGGRRSRRVEDGSRSDLGMTGSETSDRFQVGHLGKISQHLIGC